MRKLTLRQLRTVLAANRLGKINLAARELGLTPPAVTLQLQQVEIAAGTALFDRTSDGLRATDAGRAVVAVAQAIEFQLEQLADDLAAIRGVGRGTLRLGAVSTAKYFVPQLMAAFLVEHPGIDLRLSIGNRADTIAALEQQTIDIALMGRPPHQPPVNTFLIGEHPMVVIAPPGHALVGVRHIARSVIAGHPLLVRESGSGTRRSLELFLGETPGQTPLRSTEFASNETIKQAVMAGLGLALISAHTIALEAELGRIAILDVVGTPVRRQWFAVTRADRTLSPTMAAFNGFIRLRAREFLPVLKPPPS
ncbi:LysR family transcriptional regulator [Sphingosinicellaceae bacterium]|nr:LysR family transcriptional regulator [Sphingosinicellaceae bacterium]